MAFIDKIKERAKADKKTIVLPESMDKRTYEAAEKILKEGIANLIIIGTPEEIEKNGFNLNISRYVSTAQAEKRIALKDVHSELVSLEERIKRATLTHNAFLEELGLPPLPLAEKD